jgi:predicted ribosome-associated RNA-binding protein Tma20
MRNETVKLNEQLKQMQTSLLKENEYKIVSFQDEQKILSTENEKMKIEVLLKYYFIFEINKTCIVLKPYGLLCIY